ncbi:MAG TPA: alpha/beta hydrolase [Allosphingosinicella sp.]|nr:alpha/beta hydrolase [Allosphingosinicella sp.]
MSPRLPFLSLLAAALALAGCAGMVRERIYRPEPIAADRPAWQGAAPRPVSARTADGLVLHGYYWPPAAGSRDILIFFHGNAGNRETAARMAEPLARHGAGLLVASYRGYGGNPGRPSEAGLIADGAAFAALARQLQGEGRLYLVGWSLGGAVALQLAGRIPVDAVATLGAFSRLADAAPAAARPFLPDRFDNLAAIGRVAAPVYLFHGTSDEVVPYAQAARLRAASGGRATIVTIAGGGHRPDLARLADTIWQALEGRGGR